MRIDKEQTSLESKLTNNIVLATYYNQLYYKNYKNYTKYRVRLILKKLGSKVRLPKNKREVEVIRTNKVIVYLANDNSNYYFRERLLPIKHIVVERPTIIKPKSLDSSIREYLGLTKS